MQTRKPRNLTYLYKPIKIALLADKAVKLVNKQLGSFIEEPFSNAKKWHNILAYCVQFCLYTTRMVTEKGKSS